jgi:endonuclease/exonuclease/phosphatase family metal-dependent hydrolase
MERRQEEGGKVRVVTYNVHSFCDADFRHSFPRLMKQMRILQPDILALNEALHPHHPRDLPGSEHLHSTDDTSDEVVQEFLKFMKNQQSQGGLCAVPPANDEVDDEQPVQKAPFILLFVI